MSNKGKSKQRQGRHQAMKRTVQRVQHKLDYDPKQYDAHEDVED